METAENNGKKFYHLHNTGSERRIIFSSKEDFDRFEAYLYLLNAVESQRAANFFTGGREKYIFESARGENLIAIGAYSFLPQGFHILATPLVENGIGKFMQKLQTAYTMYFNRKYQRDGRLFHSAYRSHELGTDDAVRHSYGYIHANAAELFDARWENADGSQLMTLIKRALEYRYSSAGEYAAGKFVITDPSRFPQFMRRTKDVHAHHVLWMKYKGKGDLAF